MQLSVGDVFKTKNEAQNAIRMYAVDNKFGFETTDSTPKKYTIQCKERRGYGCDAIVTAALRKKDNMFVIKKLKNTHNCPQQSSCSVQSSARYIADEVRDMPDVGDARIGLLINRISSRRGIKIGYHAAWKARQDVLNGTSPTEDDGAESEACLRAVVEENQLLNPDDITVCHNMKTVISSWGKDESQNEREPRGIFSAVLPLSQLDTASSRNDTLFYLSSLARQAYAYSKKIIEISCHERYNDIRERTGYTYLAICHDAFDSPYILAMACVPEYARKKEGWMYFTEELLKHVGEGVLLFDWSRDLSTLLALEGILRKSQGIFSAFGESSGFASANFCPLDHLWCEDEIEEEIRNGTFSPAADAASRVRLFIHTRSLCREIFTLCPCSSTVSLVWSLCNSPDEDTFQMYLKKVQALEKKQVAEFLASVPTHLWARYLLDRPLYNKNNTASPDIDAVSGMLTLSPPDALCVLLKVLSDHATEKKEMVAHAEASTKKVTDKTKVGEAVARAMERNIAKAQTYDVDVGRTPGGICQATWIDPRKLNEEEECGQGIVYVGSHRFYVDLRLRVCSCIKFQEMEFPCSHACAIVLKMGGQPYAYIGDTHSLETLSKTYRGSSVKCIVNEPVRGTEEKRRGPGRPKKVQGCETDDLAYQQEHKENIKCR